MSTDAKVFINLNNKGSAVCGKVHYESSGSANKFIMKRLITLKSRHNSKFMQIQKGQIAFTELISSQSFMKDEDFHEKPRTDDHLQLNITTRSASRPNRANEKVIARREIFVSPNHTSEFSLMGDIESSYITPDGYFTHKIVLESTQEVWSSVCYGMLKLSFCARNGDQLLSINNEDTTLLCHEDALSVFENLPRNNDENITMTYRRPSTRNVVDLSFELNCSLGSAVEARINNESSVPESDWISKSAVTIQNRGTNRYMQALEKNCVIFKEPISSIPGQKPKDFHICHFTEERRIESSSHAMLRRYMDEEHKDYLHVTCDGNIILSSTCSVFKLKVGRMRAFVIMEEIVTGKVLCLEDFNDCCAKFIYPTNYAADHNYIDHMEENLDSRGIA